MNNFETTPVDVFVYIDKADIWCTTKEEEDMEGYLIQTIKAVPTTDPITFEGNGEEEIEVGDVFCLTEDGTPNMVRVEFFEDPKPQIVLVIEKGYIRNAYSLTGDSNFCFAVIDLDIKGGENTTWKDIPSTTYVVDGCADSVEQIISEL
jgi:beta-galactosidase/beta-glucuronidase